MIPAKFDYVRPSSLDAAVEALAGGGEDAKVIAGGQSLLPLLRLRLAYPSLLVDIGGLGELTDVRDVGDALVIGAMTTMYSLIRDPLIREHCGLIAAAAGTVADPAVRHRATIGGSLAHADPAGDLPAVIAALDGTLIATGPGGEREIAPADFFVDYLTTTLAPDEILTAVRVPKLGYGWGFRYEKFQPTAQAWDAQVIRLARRIPSLGIPPRPVGFAALYDVADDWIPVYDRTSLAGFYVAIGTSGNQFKNAPVAGRFMAALVHACENGHDHDSDPVLLSGHFTKNEINLGHYSRLRQPHAESSNNVMG